MLAAGAVTALVATIPIWYLLLRVLEAGPERVVDILARPGIVDALLTSAALALVVATAATVAGVGLAWLAARTTLPGGRAWSVLLVLPLAVPSYVAAYAWVSLFPAFSGFWAAALVLTLSCTPYVVLPVLAALRQGEEGTAEMARSLGAGSWRVFRTVTLPAIWPAAAAGGLLAALYTLAEFGSVAILRVDTLTRDIFVSFSAAFDRTAALVQSLLLIALALLLVLAERWARGEQRRWRVARSAARPPRRLRLSRPVAAGALLLMAGWAALGLLVPAVALVGRMAVGSRGGTDAADVASAALSTAGVALLGAVLAVLLALPIALLASRYRTRAVRALETASFAGHALPGVVVGLSLVFLTLAVLPGLYQTMATLALAYAVLFLPKAIGSARSALGMVPPDLEWVARSQGRGPAAAFASVTGRIATPGILAGGLLVMVTAMKELPATLMLRPTGFDTLATEMWSRTEVAAYGAAAPYAVVLVLVAAVPAVLLARGVVPAREARPEPGTLGQ